MKMPHDHWLTKVLYCIGWICIILLVLIGCIHTLYLFPGTSNILTDSDIIQLPTMFLDLKADLGNFWGWKLPEAPYYFPDTLVFLLINWLVQDSWLSIAVYSLVQACLTVFSLTWLYQEIGGKRREVFLMFLLTAILVFTKIYTTIFISPEGFVAPYIYYLASYIHFGTYICSLFCLAGSLNYLRTKKTSLLLAISATIFITTASDLTFAIYFTIPFIITLAIVSKTRLFSFSIITNRFYYIIFSTSLVAYVFNKYCDPLAATTTVEIKLSKIFLSVKTIGIDLLQTEVNEQIFLTCTIVLPLFYLIVSTIRLGTKYHELDNEAALPELHRSNNRDKSILQFITYLYVVISVILNIIVVIILGKYENIANVRYFLFIYYSPGLIALILVSLLLEKIKHINSIITAATVAISIISFASIVTQQSPSISQIFSPPDYANCFSLDQHQAGLAGYWQSKTLITFSQRKIQIATIDKQGKPEPWNNNRYWYTNSWTKPGSLPEFQFIFMKSLDKNAIATRYGQPDTIEACTDSEIWRYKDSQALYSNLMKDGL